MSRIIWTKEKIIYALIWGLSIIGIFLLITLIKMRFPSEDEVDSAVVYIVRDAYEVYLDEEPYPEFKVLNSTPELMKSRMEEKYYQVKIDEDGKIIYLKSSQFESYLLWGLRILYYIDFTFMGVLQLPKLWHL